MSMLSDIVDSKKDYVKQLKKCGDLTLCEHIQKPNLTFKQALQKSGLSVIAEVKKASPSKGIICVDFDPLEIATRYVEVGASALSVLTDELFFKGHVDFLIDIKRQVQVPVLRKDFIIDPLQVRESFCIGADAILLILSILSVKQAQELIDCAKEYHLDVLVELHDSSEIDQLSSLKGVDIIGINNRNLNTFEVDISHSLVMKKKLDSIYDSHVFVAESGYSCSDQMDTLSENRFDAVLIGEGLVKNPEFLEYFRHEN